MPVTAKQFSVYDFLVDLIPGIIVIVVCFSLLPYSYIVGIVGNASVFQGVLLLGVGYVLGQILQAVASPIDSWYTRYRGHKYPFEERVSKAREQDETTVGTEFLRLCTEKFTTTHPDTKTEFTPPDKELFGLTQSYLFDNNIGRFHRFQVTYTLFRSLWVVFVFGGIAHILIGIATLYIIELSNWPIGSSLAVALISIGLGYICYLRRLKYQNLMADSMITDFYTHEVS